LVYADPDPTFHPDPDPLKSANIGLISANWYGSRSSLKILMRIQVTKSDAAPDP
jgi:hypothetical protein